ncbi:hypothetical protein CYMTET_13317 [Cymbomonas tetramitiformis]|uniref:Uncharacterized protein n=1 Tax=Cymbomonas tetramitiformis TaxID=36881 RepID=A0AAE0GIQ1_9CHLO|nr:hypothetical protein CYMTET_13317 [Cymbomonas tetramitiformis]
MPANLGAAEHGEAGSCARSYQLEETRVVGKVHMEPGGGALERVGEEEATAAAVEEPKRAPWEGWGSSMVKVDWVEALCLWGAVVEGVALRHGIAMRPPRRTWPSAKQWRQVAQAGAQDACLRSVESPRDETEGVAGGLDMEYVLGGRQLVEARPPPDLPAGEGACSGGSNDVLAAMASAGQQGRV